MSGEVFDGQDAGYVPENPDFPQNHSDEHNEGNVIDEAGFPQLQPDEHDVGNLTEDAIPPEHEFDGHGVEDIPENVDSHPQEHTVTEEEEHRDEGDVPDNFTSQEKQGQEDVSKASETKKWPGWPGENVFRMLVPVQKVGSIIGRKGEFIKKITEETKARIKILDGPPGTTERAVMVSAKEEPDRTIPPAVEGLLRVHKQVVNVDHDPADSASGAGRPVVTKLLVADTQAGSLIGKQGSTIKSFQDGSGCNIRVLGSEHLPIFALRDDSLVEIQGESAGVHKAVELIALHLRKFLVDRSIVGVFETQMQRPDIRVNQNVPPHQPWGPPPPPQGFPGPAPGGGGGPGFAPNPQYMPPPAHNYENYYPPADLPPMDKHLHQGPPPAYVRGDAPVGIHSSSAPPQQSVVAKVTQHMQIPLSYADAVIGASGSNISYIRRASGASITIQETRGVPGEMTVEISGTASQIQAAQQLVQNFMAEAASAAQDHMGGSINQGYNSYPTNAPIYASPPSSATGHTGHPPSADYGPVRNLGPREDAFFHTQRKTISILFLLSRLRNDNHQAHGEQTTSSNGGGGFLTIYHFCSGLFLLKERWIGLLEWVGGGDDGAEEHDGEEDDGEVDGVRGEDEGDVALFDPDGGEGGGDSVHSEPEVVVGDVVASMKPMLPWWEWEEMKVVPSKEGFGRSGRGSCRWT